MQSVVVVSLCLLLVLLLWLALNAAKQDEWLDRGVWHVPDSHLPLFSLQAFVLCRDYLFIYNQLGDVLHDGPVNCSAKDKTLRIYNGPSFLQSVTIETNNDGFDLVDHHGEVVAFIYCIPAK